MGVLADNYDLWAGRDAQRERHLAKFPRCGYCGEAITDDYFFVIKRTNVCESCLNKEHRRYTEDYLGE
jgi:hypothetical protein